MDVRTEDREQAIELDRRVFDLYAGHPHLIEVDSHASVLDKLTSVRNAIAKLLDGDDAGPSLRLVPDQREAPMSPLLGLSSVQHVLSTD
jgi:hypothetical protein